MIEGMRPIENEVDGFLYLSNWLLVQVQHT